MMMKKKTMPRVAPGVKKANKEIPKGRAFAVKKKKKVAKKY